jgi:hypothetical protein
MDTFQGRWRLTDHTVQIIPAHHFEKTYLKIAAQLGGFIPWSCTTIQNSKSVTEKTNRYHIAEMENVPEMPNPLQTLTDDEELYVIMLPLWCDDVSGNKSKQYNKHINMYMANSNLPGCLLQQEYFVCFVATSPHATSPEQFSAVIDEIK